MTTGEKIILAQAAPEAQTGPTVAVIGTPEAATADIVISGNYTIIGIFMIWAGLIAFAWVLVRRAKQGAFRIDPNLGKRADADVPFQPFDRMLNFIGTFLAIAGFGLVLLDLFRG